MWLTALQKELGGEVSDERMRDYIWNTLKSGRVKTQHTSLNNARCRHKFSRDKPRKGVIVLSAVLLADCSPFFFQISITKKNSTVKNYD